MEVLMPSEALTATFEVDDSRVTLIFDCVIGDQPVTAEDGISIYEHLVSDVLHQGLRSLEPLGIISPEITGNVLTFSFLLGLDSRKLIASAASVIAVAHGKVPVLFAS